MSRPVSPKPTVPRDAPAARRLVAETSLLLVAIIWGCNMPVMKFALGRMDEYLFNALRLTLSTIVLGICVLIQTARKSSEHREPRTRSWWANLLLFSFLTGFAYQICFLKGIDATTAGNTALIMSALPMWTAILAWIILRERLSTGAWCGLLVAVAGVLIVTLHRPVVQQDGIAGGFMVGNLLVSLATFSWALASVLSRPIMKTISPLNLALVSVAMTLPLHYLVAWHAIGQLSLLLTDPWLMAALFYSGAFSTGMAYAMWNLGVQVLGPAHAAGFQNLVPLIALVASWVLISEIPMPLQLAGGTLIIAGLIMMRKRRAKN